MEKFARVVLGYHGCSRQMADDLLTGRVAIEAWGFSENPYDWLGRGIYFWEHSPYRAYRWAQHKAREAERKGKTFEPGIIGAVIQLGRCFDLTDLEYTGRLAEAYDQLEKAAAADGWSLPTNQGKDPDLKSRKLDCLVVNTLMDGTVPPFQTARAAFWEGAEAYPGATFLQESHIQIAVRDRDCILGVFRPQFMKD